ncbi:hypothetical protein QBC44DRAFT_357366 [Cladorrhinum sp. PSN332]|nr:hypothetical protein QBC44DRAFT_357366 [Cladorrhinum sp. PSN332]
MNSVQDVTSDSIELQILPPPVTRPSTPSSWTVSTRTTRAISNALNVLSSTFSWIREHSDALGGGLIGLLTVLLAAVLIRPTLRAAEDGRISKQLAEWNSEKDFIEYCEAHPFVKGTCEIARNLTLPAPPGFPPAMRKRMSEDICTWTFIDSTQHVLGESIRTLALALSCCLILRVIDERWVTYLMRPLRQNSPYRLLAHIAVAQVFFNTSDSTSSTALLFATYLPWWPVPIFTGSDTLFLILGKVPGPVLEIVFLFLCHFSRNDIRVSQGLAAVAAAVMAKQTAAYFALDMTEIWKGLVELADEKEL